MMKANSGKTGQMTELKAQLWLLDQGYEVFANVVPNGPVDIIALNKETGELSLFDVKTVTVQQFGNKKPYYSATKLREEQTSLGVKKLVYMKCRDEFMILDGSISHRIEVSETLSVTVSK